MIIGVHGIGKQQLGPAQLERVWKPALWDGMYAAGARKDTGLRLRIAYYGGLFLQSPVLPVTVDPAAKGTGGNAGDTADGRFEDMSAPELSALTDAVEEAVGAQALAAAQASAAKGYTRTPQPVQGLLRALDQRFGVGAGVLYLGSLRQVRSYLCDPVLKSKTDAIVDETIDTVDVEPGGGCRVLMGHSLGSVVAWEYVRRHPEREWPLLLTVGSPLGLRMVRQLLPDQGFGTDPARRPQLRRWVNVRDERDPVTCAGPLKRWWAGVEEELVDNGGDAHSISRYLGKEQSGAAIWAADPAAAS